MTYQKTIERSGNCDQDINMILNDIKTAGLVCDVLQSFTITSSTVTLTYEDARCSIAPTPPGGGP